MESCRKYLYKYAVLIIYVTTSFFIFQMKNLHFQTPMVYTLAICMTTVSNVFESKDEMKIYLTISSLGCLIVIGFNSNNIIFFMLYLTLIITWPLLIFIMVKSKFEVEDSLEKSKKFLEEVFNASIEPTALMDKTKGIIIDCSDMIIENLKLDNKSDLIGKDLHYINEKYLNSSIDSQLIDGIFIKTDFDVNIPVTDLNGEKQYKIKIKSFEIGEDSYCIISFIDKTKEVIYNQKIFELAFIDELTNLSNRRKALKDLDELVNDSNPKNDKFAILFIDIDKFKEINDAYGHDVGDVTLQIASRRLENSVDSKDYVSRIGGDEFMIILKDMQSKEQNRLILLQIEL
jgi:predicted signal transduction protein with EAL and GGDEF domain